MHDVEIKPTNIVTSLDNLPCIPGNGKLVCLPADIQAYCKVDLHDSLVKEKVRIIWKTMWEILWLFSKHCGDIGYICLVTVDISIENLLL